ncbi:helix-turn-helix domain-containing protein [uncultured Thomasclavelia sp.]|uniref:helix-turn-helix domain-containing protein n=1 Tax=uncultured Thomasclavelia sp. TaxID=3025759 RepID=UPI0025997F6A|nr:helix-turn-helix transcriptional regulator [uncultured Thomasclavelia sp.]
MANKDFSKIIRKLRLDAKLTMDELANKVGVKKSTISMWENSNVVPRDDILIKLSAIFDVSIDYLLGNIKRGTPSNTKLEYIQRNLEKLDEKKLSQAENVLKAVFNDIFEEEEDHNGL